MAIELQGVEVCNEVYLADFILILDGCLTYFKKNVNANP